MHETILTVAHAGHAGSHAAEPGLALFIVIIAIAALVWSLRVMR